MSHKVRGTFRRPSEINNLYPSKAYKSRRLRPENEDVFAGKYNRQWGSLEVNPKYIKTSNSGRHIYQVPPEQNRGDGKCCASYSGLFNTQLNADQGLSSGSKRPYSALHPIYVAEGYDVSNRQLDYGINSNLISDEYCGYYMAPTLQKTLDLPLNEDPKSRDRALKRRYRTQQRGRVGQAVSQMNENEEDSEDTGVDIGAEMSDGGFGSGDESNDFIDPDDEKYDDPEVDTGRSKFTSPQVVDVTEVKKESQTSYTKQDETTGSIFRNMSTWPSPIQIDPLDLPDLESNSPGDNQSVSTTQNMQPVSKLDNLRTTLPRLKFTEISEAVNTFRETHAKRASQQQDKSSNYSEYNQTLLVYVEEQLKAAKKEGYVKATNVLTELVFMIENLPATVDGSDEKAVDTYMNSKAMLSRTMEIYDKLDYTEDVHEYDDLTSTKWTNLLKKEIYGKEVDRALQLKGIEFMHRITGSTQFRTSTKSTLTSDIMQYIMNEENFVNSQDVYADSDLQGSNGTGMDVEPNVSPSKVPQTQSQTYADVASTPPSTGQTQQKNKQRSKRKGSKKKKTNKKTNKKTAPPKD